MKTYKDIELLKVLKIAEDLSPEEFNNLLQIMIFMQLEGRPESEARKSYDFIISELSREQDLSDAGQLKAMTTKEARGLLESKGYYTGNLWCVDDCDADLTYDEAIQVLDKALTEEAVMEIIWDFINFHTESIKNK